MTKKINEILNNTVNGKRIYGGALNIQRGDGEVIFDGVSGNIRSSDQFFIASTTKMMTTAIILKLRKEGKLALSDKVIDFFPEKYLACIHEIAGKDYSAEITIKHLLAHTSGLADYFNGKTHVGKSVEERLLRGEDFEWDLDFVLDNSRQQGAKFIPGKPGKAYYSDTNFQLLGEIIEKITGMSQADAYFNILFKPLGLKNTFMASDRNLQELDMVVKM